MMQGKHTLYWLHGITMIVGFCICATMIYGVVSGTDRGHPPAIVFLPLVIVVWVFLHVFLMIIQWLKNRGNSDASVSNDASINSGTRNSWPFSLIIFVILCGIASLVGFAGLANILYSGRLPAYSSQWLALLFNGFAFICLCGILLRKNWGRLVSGTGCIFVSGFMVYRIAMRVLTTGYEINSSAHMLVVIGVLGLGYFGYHLLTSASVKAFTVN